MKQYFRVKYLLSNSLGFLHRNDTEQKNPNLYLTQTSRQSLQELLFSKYPLLTSKAIWREDTLSGILNNVIILQLLLLQTQADLGANLKCLVL